MQREQHEALIKLTKILVHEQRLGYADRSVSGGLEGLINRWADNTDRGEDNRLYARLRQLFVGYHAASSSERQQCVDHSVTMLNEMADGGQGHQDNASMDARAGPLMEKPEDSGGEASSRGAKPRQHRNPSSHRRGQSTINGGTGTVKDRTVQRAATSRLDVPVTRLARVSAGFAKRFEKLNVYTVRDLLYHFPRRHVDYRSTKKIRDLTVGQVETVMATIWDVHARRARSGMTITELVAGDETGTVGAVWFNQPYLTQTIVANRQVVLSGRVEVGVDGRPYFKSPDWEILGGEELVHTGRMVPVYPLTEGISGRWLRRLIKSSLNYKSPELEDPLPRELRHHFALVDLETAICQMHFPDDDVMKERARRRLAFDELLLIQLAMLQRRRAEVETQPGIAFQVDQDVLDRLAKALPFVLTSGQQQAAQEILADMGLARPMARLLQGEVGSGKTVVAAIAMMVAAANGQQSVLMAPTEILADQHYRTLTGLFESIGTVPNCAEPRPVAVAALTGSMSRRQKQAVYDAVAQGKVDVLVGTHAVIQEDLRPKCLGLVIIDEQHRFGVEQRAALREKGYCPDLLVMTATPIPRTLALTLYGDLDISAIRERPPGRQEVKTLVLGPEQRQRAYEFCRRHVTSGEQVFVICPLVEESEKIEAKAATAEYARLQNEIFPELRVGLLHGRMGGKQKDAVMHAFRANDLQVLVSTAVVEVGIDVPNATIMLVEGADRFGLSQLHQFRGRVGRGSKESYCILLSDSPSDEAEQRLQILARVSDGIALAEQDLRLRGPGEFFGTRQSGMPNLKVATLGDTALLEEARAAAQRVLDSDPLLAAPEHRLLAAHVAAFWSDADLS